MIEKICTIFKIVSAWYENLVCFKDFFYSINIIRPVKFIMSTHILITGT